MQEKRRNKRFVVQNIEGSLTFSTSVNILNINIDGVALKASRRLDIGKEYTLQLEHGGETISVRGGVVWSVLSDLGEGQDEGRIPIYKAGMKFENIPSDTMRKLLDFIEENKLTEDHRLTMRFDIKSPEKAILSIPHSYSVKNISMSGMCIEIDLPFSIEERFPMEIFLPGNTALKFSGRIAFCSELAAGVPKHYDVGIDFLEMSEVDRAKLKGYIEFL